MTALRILTSLLKDNRAGTAIEYGLIVALIVIACISAMSGVADENTGLWARVSSKTEDAMSGP